jgi:hypothetical protein
MLREPFHLSDQDILLLLDGEIPRRRARKARAHLNACWVCRARMGRLEGTIEDFVSLHRRTLDPELADPAGPRALLKTRLAEAAVDTSIGQWSNFLQSIPLRPAAYICIAVLSSVFAGAPLVRHFQDPRSAGLTFATMAVPDHDLTPGATRPVSVGEVCSMPHEEVVHDVSSSLRQEVFKEYGIVNPRPQDYEIDYLIAPGLGGIEDIHNLWPEPSTPSAWNAHAKDVLEERLHQLVCDGELDLPTAQRAIATDWIQAYKKYCGVDSFQDRSDGTSSAI